MAVEMNPGFRSIGSGLTQPVQPGEEPSGDEGSSVGTQGASPQLEGYYKDSFQKAAFSPAIFGPDPTAVPADSVRVPGQTVYQKRFPKLESNDHDPLVKKDAIVIHQTGAETAQSTFNQYENPGSKSREGVGAHFLVDTDGTIYQTAGLDRQAWHVGQVKSRCQEEGTCSPADEQALKKAGPQAIDDYEKKKAYPDRYPTNQDSIGIEVVGAFDKKTGQYSPPTDAQIKATGGLVNALRAKYGIGEKDVYPHEQISHKSPGEGSGFGYD